MPLLTEYDRRLVVFHCFENLSDAEKVMRKAISIYWPKRKNKIARQRIKSACKTIKSIRKDHTPTQPASDGP